MWDCGMRNLADSRALVLDFLQEGKQVYLYRQEDRDMPVRYEDDQIKSAREKISLPPPVVLPGKSDALKKAEKDLKKIKAKRKLKFSGAH
jgi:hypothetical protein